MSKSLGGPATRAGVVPAIDGFRAYAIFVVVALHLLAISGVLRGRAETPFAVAVWGLAGNVIDVFFILSGFLLFLPVVARGGVGNLREYALNRAARLFPAYWLALAISLSLALLLDRIADPGLGEIAIHLGGFQMPARMVDPDFIVGFGVNGPLWMISVIIGFYVVLPLIARPYLRHPLIGLGLAAAITIGWKAGADVFADGSRGWLMELIAIDQLPAWAFSFALGMTGAWGWTRWRSRERSVPPSAALGALAFGLCAFAACAYAYGQSAAEINAAFAGSYARADEWLGIAYSAARALVLGAVLVGPWWLQRPFASRPARKLAQLTYGMYLIHLPMALAVGVVLLELPADGSVLAVIVWFGVVLTLSLGYAELTRRYFERPIVRRVRRRSPQRAAALQSPARAAEEPDHARREARLPA